MTHEERIIRVLEAQHIRHVQRMAEKAAMKPNAEEEIDFFRTDDSSEMVGVFLPGDLAHQLPMAVAGLLYDSEKNYFVLLIVDEQHRKKGMGEQLVRWAIEKSQKAQTSPQVLQLVASQMGSPLYKRLGFVGAGYSNLYELQLKDKGGRPEMSLGERKQILSCCVSNLSAEQDGELLWRKSLEMLFEVNKCKRRTARLRSLLKDSTVHLLYKKGDRAESKLLAWAAVRPFSQTSRVIGPIIGRSVEHAIDLVRMIPSYQLEIDNKAKIDTTSSLDNDSLVIHTDSHSEQEPPFREALEQLGWRQITRLEILQMDLGESKSNDRNTSESKQYALTDFSHQ